MSIYGGPVNVLYSNRESVEPEIVAIVIGLITKDKVSKYQWKHAIIKQL